MSDFKAKMYQIQFRLAGLRGLLLREGEGTGRGLLLREGEGTGRGGEGEGRSREGDGKGRDPTPSRRPNPYFWIRLWSIPAPELEWSVLEVNWIILATEFRPKNDFRGTTNPHTEIIWRTDLYLVTGAPKTVGAYMPVGCRRGTITKFA